MEKFVGTMDMSLADILGFENESDLFNKQAKVCLKAFTHLLGGKTISQLAVRVATIARISSTRKYSSNGLNKTGHN